MSEVETITVAVCPHDSARALPLWLELMVVLGNLSGHDLNLVTTADFEEFYAAWDRARLVYANPLDALKLDGRGFLPIAQSPKSDEVVFVVAEGVEPTLASFAGQPLACVEGQFASFLGQDLLKKAGFVPGEIVCLPSWSEVLNALRGGRLKHGLLYKDFFESLSPVSLEGVRVVEVSNDGRFGHLWMLHPELRAIADDLKAALAKLPEHPMGQLVQADLGFGPWKLEPDLAPLKALVQS